MEETQREDNNKAENIAENKDETESFNKNNDVVGSVDDENISQATSTKNDGQKEVSLEEYMEVEEKLGVGLKRKAENNTGASPREQEGDKNICTKQRWILVPYNKRWGRRWRRRRTKSRQVNMDSLKIMSYMNLKATTKHHQFVVDCLESSPWMNILRTSLYMVCLVRSHK